MAPYKAGMEGTEEAEEETASGDLIAMNRLDLLPLGPA